MSFNMMLTVSGIFQEGRSFQHSVSPHSLTTVLQII